MKSVVVGGIDNSMELDQQMLVSPDSSFLFYNVNLISLLQMPNVKKYMFL